MQTASAAQKHRRAELHALASVRIEEKAREATTVTEAMEEQSNK